MEKAAEVIARFMRNVYPFAKTAHLAKCVLSKGGITIEQAETGKVLDVVSRLRKRYVLKSLKHMVLRICRATITQSSRKAFPGIPDVLNVREFAVAYLISCQPAFCFEDEQDSFAMSIQNVAYSLLECFERICNAAVHGALQGCDEKDLQCFPKLLSKYMTAFQVSCDVLPSFEDMSAY